MQARAHLAHAFAGTRAVQVSATLLERYAVLRSGEGAAPAGFPSELACLRRGFSLAVKAGRLDTRPSFPSIRVDNARRGSFEPEEFERVVTALPDPLKNVVRFAYYMGWRSAEIRGLTWADVDSSAGTVRLDAARSKNGERRGFPSGALPPRSHR
jgi:integrase